MIFVPFLWGTSEIATPHPVLLRQARSLCTSAYCWVCRGDTPNTRKNVEMDHWQQRPKEVINLHEMCTCSFIAKDSFWTQQLTLSRVVIAHFSKCRQFDLHNMQLRLMLHTENLHIMLIMAHLLNTLRGLWNECVNEANPIAQTGKGVRSMMSERGEIRPVEDNSHNNSVSGPCYVLPAFQSWFASGNICPCVFEVHSNYFLLNCEWLHLLDNHMERFLSHRH